MVISKNSLNLIPTPFIIEIFGGGRDGRIKQGGEERQGKGGNTERQLKQRAIGRVVWKPTLVDTS